MTKVLFLLCYHSKLHTPKTWTIRHCSILCCVTIQNYIHLKLIYHHQILQYRCVTIQNYIHLKHTCINSAKFIQLCYHSKLHTPKTICVQHPEHKKLCYHSKLHTPKTSILHFLLPFIFLTKMRFQPYILNLSKIQFQTVTYHLNNFTSTYILLYKKIIKILVYKKYSLSFQRRNL